MRNKIFKIAYYVFLGALCLIALLVVISAFPIKGNIQIKIVQSGSMEPSIKTGSLVLIKPASSYKIGDAVTFSGNLKDSRGNRMTITHCIVDMAVNAGAPLYITKGDANEEQDSGQLSQNEIIGKVLLDVPYVGYGVAATKTKYGFLAIILIPAIIIIYDQSVRIFKEAKRVREKRANSVKFETK